MPSQFFGQTQQRVHALVSAARSGLTALSNQVAQIRADTRYTEEGSREEVALTLGEGATSVRGTIEDAQSSLRVGFQQANTRLSSLLQVTPEALADRRQALRPILDRSFDDPEVLLRLYRDHSGEPATRRALEDHCAYLTSALGPEGAQLAQSWQALQEELVVQRPPEEREALEDRAALSELQAYVDAAEVLVNIDLAALQDGGVSDSQMVPRSMRESEINLYESTHGLKSSLPGAA